MNTVEKLLDQLNHQIEDQNKSCVSCAHVTVCALVRAIGPLLEQWKSSGAKPPLDVKDLAMICKAFSPMFVSVSD